MSKFIPYQIFENNYNFTIVKNVIEGLRRVLVLSDFRWDDPVVSSYESINIRSSSSETISTYQIYFPESTPLRTPWLLSNTQTSFPILVPLRTFSIRHLTPPSVRYLLEPKVRFYEIQRTLSLLSGDFLRWWPPL